MAKVIVRYFSMYKDLVGVDEEEYQDIEKLNDLLQEVFNKHPELKKYVDEYGLIVLVNDEIAGSNDIALKDGDVVSLLPPASGGSRCVLTNELPKSLDSVVEELKLLPSTGCIGIFIGIVKSHVDGHAVKHLSYDAHPSAAKILNKVVEDVVKKHGLSDAIVYHKIGQAKPGELTTIIAVAAKSRKDCLEALNDIISHLKHDVPIWKLEVRDDGEYWVIGDRRVKRK